MSNNSLFLSIDRLYPRLFLGSRIEGPSFRCYNKEQINSYCDQKGWYIWYDRLADVYVVCRKQQKAVY